MNSIFRHFISHDNTDHKRIAYASWFVNAFPETEFDGDERIFYDFVKYCTHLDVQPCYKYLEVYLSTELRKLLVAERIHVPGTESLSFDDPSALEAAIRTTATVLGDDYKSLEELDESIEDFPVDVQKFMHERHANRLTQVLSDTFNKLQQTDDTEKAADYAESELSLVNDVYDMTVLDDLVDKPVDNVKTYKVCEFGLPAIDKDSDGIWSKQLVGIEAQPGTGKTRFAVDILYNAAVYNKRNVLFITLEQDEDEIKAMFIAKHIFTMFGSVITDNRILHDNVPKELTSQVEAAKLDLFDSDKYGKIVVKSEDLYVETFVNRLKTLDRLYGPFNIMTIDYMGLLGSKAVAYRKEKEIYDIVKDGFRQYKRYVRRTNKAGIAVSQFNKQGIEAGKADKQITTDMAEGGIAVYKNTDFNIAISMTDTMKLQRKRRMSQPKVRGSNGFGSIIVDTNLGICYFKQQEQQEV